MDNNKRNESLLNVIARLETRFEFVNGMWEQTRKQVDSACAHAAEAGAKSFELQKDLADAHQGMAESVRQIIKLKDALAEETKARIHVESQLKAVLKNNKAVRRANNGRFK